MRQLRLSLAWHTTTITEQIQTAHTQTPAAHRAAASIVLTSAAIP